MAVADCVSVGEIWGVCVTDAVEVLVDVAENVWDSVALRVRVGVGVAVGVCVPVDEGKDGAAVWRALTSTAPSEGQLPSLCAGLVVPSA